MVNTKKAEKRVTIKSFAGLNNELDPDLIKDNEFQQLVNLNVTPARTLKKRPGFKNWSSQTGVGASKILAIYDTGVGTPQLIAAFSDGVNNITRASTDGGVTWPTAVHATRAFKAAVQYNGLLYMVDGTGVAKWDGTTFTAIGSSPAGCSITAFKDRLWVTDGLRASNFYFSDVGPSGVETWGVSSIIKIKTGDPSALVYSLPFADRLILFKTMTVWNLFLSGNTASWQLRILNTERGAIGENCVLTFQGLIYMLSYDGLWRSDGAVFREVSDRVRQYFKKNPLPNKDSNCAISLSNRRIMVTYRQSALSAVSGVIPCAYLWYVLDSDSWSEMQLPSGIAEWRPLSVFNWYNSGGQPTLPTNNQLVDSWSVGVSDSKTIFTLDEAQGLDRGFAFNCSLSTKILDFGDFMDMKRLKLLLPELDGAGAIPSITYSRDNELDDIRVPAGALVVSGAKVYRIEGAGYFRQLTLKISEASSSPLRVLTLNFIVMVKSLVGADT